MMIARIEMMLDQSQLCRLAQCPGRTIAYLQLLAKARKRTLASAIRLLDMNVADIRVSPIVHAPIVDKSSLLVASRQAEEQLGFGW